MGTIKDRNGMDLIEVEEINKRGQEYTEELYKKDLTDLDNQMVCSLTQSQNPGVGSQVGLRKPY